MISLSINLLKNIKYNPSLTPIPNFAPRKPEQIPLQLALKLPKSFRGIRPDQLADQDPQDNPGFQNPLHLGKRDVRLKARIVSMRQCKLEGACHCY